MRHDRPLVESDPLVHEALVGERERQQAQIELIASENIVSRGVREALGHEITNKTLEGYPGSRFHGGGRFVDLVEQAAIERARALFGAAYVNVQPHSGVQANQAVFFALVKPGRSHLEYGSGGRRSPQSRRQAQSIRPLVRSASLRGGAGQRSSGLRGHCRQGGGG